jgi:CRISPR-associated protein Cas2
MDIRRFYGNKTDEYGRRRIGMMVLITYDVSTEDAQGASRLRKVAKQCVNYGQRVQNSVFECVLDLGQCKLLKAKLLDIIDMERDSLRFYYLGVNYKNKIEHYGTKEIPEQEGVLLL